MTELPISFSLNTETIVALITLAGVILSIKYSHSAKSEAGAANRAVNNRGPEEPSIYNLVLDTYKEVVQMKTWKDSYDGGPLDSGPKVSTFVEGVNLLHEDVGDIKDSLEQLRTDVIKYGCPVKLGHMEECQDK